MPATTEVARYQVETYISGRAYKERRFADRAAAEAYQRELFAMRHYYVPIIDLETADRAYWGTRLDQPLPSDAAKAVSQ